jgi:hypothetical protein
VGTLFALISIDLLTEESMLFNVSKRQDIIRTTIEQRKLKEKLLSSFEDFNVKQQKIVLEEQAKLQEEIARIEQERLDALDNDNKDNEKDPATIAYTLEDRDKKTDYNNLFDPSVEHLFIVDFTQVEWDGLNNDMEVYNDLYGTYKSNNYRKVNVTYFGDNEEIFIQDVGIRSKGNIFSRYLPEENGTYREIHYALKFNETFETVEGTEAYANLKTREVFDLEKIYCKWNRNYDPTYISEIYSNQLFRDAGVVAPNMTLAKFVIRIDGEEIQSSLYNISESLDEEFVRRYFQETPTKEVGDLYKVVWPGTLEPLNSNDYYPIAQEYPSYPKSSLKTFGVRNWETNERPTYGKETNDHILSYENLLDFTQALGNNNQTQLKAYLDTHFNVDNWLRTLAVSVYLGNPDDYRSNSNNYYLYFDENDYLTYIPFDFDHSLGQGWDGGSGFIDYSVGNDIYIWKGNNNPTSPLVTQILEIEEYQIIYENYLEEFITDKTFSYASFNTLYNTYEGIYGDEFTMSNNKFNYITTKINSVLEDVEYYRSQRN